MARLRAVASEHSSDWLNAIPISGLGLKLDDASFRVVCGLRLGLTLCKTYTCRCGQSVDELGRHGLSCSQAKGTIPRHSQVNDLIRGALRIAQIPNCREPGGLDRRGQNRPDGMTLMPWSKGRHLAWDFTCNDMLATTYIPLTSVEAGRLADKQEEMKLKKYENLASSHIVMPVAIETLGSWGQMGLSFIKELGLRLITVTK